MEEIYFSLKTPKEYKRSIVDEIESLENISKDISKDKDSDKLLMSTPILTKSNKKKKNKKKNKHSLNSFIDDDDLILNDDDLDLLDADEFANSDKFDDNDDIVDEQKKGYNKLKKSNDYKKEFAEELTLLYTLLDETSKFGKDLEKKYKDTTSQKIRGVSKYTNDLAQLVINTKQNKLSILKEIAAIKKSIADLKLKSDSKNKNDDVNDSKRPEYIATAYLKNILSHGRSNLINAIDNNYTYSDMVDELNSDDDIEDNILDKLEYRLKSEGNQYRSSDGSKYIEYENKGVKILVKKCIDTGEWKFIAKDKNGEIVDDYPLPTKRDAGKMKFSDDGTYCTDEKGRMYKVLEYYLPDDEDEYE